MSYIQARIQMTLQSYTQLKKKFTQRAVHSLQSNRPKNDATGRYRMFLHVSYKPRTGTDTHRPQTNSNNGQARHIRFSPVSYCLPKFNRTEINLRGSIQILTDTPRPGQQQSPPNAALIKVTSRLETSGTRRKTNKNSHKISQVTNNDTIALSRTTGQSTALRHNS